jgi:hypothetical protein
MAKFEEGAARFMTKSNYEKYGIGQVDKTSFVMPKSEADALLARTNGDPRLMEEALGLPKGFLENNPLVRIDIPKPDDFGLRIPSGNEAGANDQWLPGGKLPTGANEAVIDVKGMQVGKDFFDAPVKLNPVSNTSTTPKGIDPPDPIKGPTAGKDPIDPVTPKPTTDPVTPKPTTDPVTAKPPTAKDTTEPTPGKPGKDTTPDDPRARGIDGAENRPPANNNKGPDGKPRNETTTTSLDGQQQFHNDVRNMSPEARHAVRQLEQHGSVRVDKISPKDLIDISKWFGREIGVVQSPFGKLRLVLGTEDGVLKVQIAPDEVFVVHTHPVMVTKAEHLSKTDLPNAGKHTEAVIDWSGRITYFNKSGIQNEVVLGVVQPLRDYKAAFIDDAGNIVGFARVDIIDGPDGATVKVRE